MKALVSLAALVFVLGSASATAASWVRIGSNNAGSSYDVDWDSVSRDGNLVTFTLRVQYAPATTQNGADGFVALRQANCADGSFTDLHTDYMLKGKVLNTTSADDAQKARGATIAESVLKTVCSKRG